MRSYIPTCGCCHEEISPGDAETCPRCGEDLCIGCWDEVGHCGHEEASASHPSIGVLSTMVKRGGNLRNGFSPKKT
jgi:hypothetical protein